MPKRTQPSKPMSRHPYIPKWCLQQHLLPHRQISILSPRTKKIRKPQARHPNRNGAALLAATPVVALPQHTPIGAQVSTGVEPEGVTPEEEAEPITMVVPAHKVQRGHIKTDLVHRPAINRALEVIQTLLGQQGNVTVVAIPATNANHAGPIQPNVRTVGKRGTSLQCVANPSSKKLHQEVQPHILKAHSEAFQLSETPHHKCSQ